ncbi:reticulocyte binding protein, putative [Plasmodium relictum]|uniref:Reticulocyte binding protein, putative n=1 Tax=Plasmodium relictum TaxID=85471 RepID=A0A1J1GKE9_PLARL|nr:reticulocyte binding protein, putative [Plasmodium relictum]CRG85178.1 reticulocyte binding protein, putative [Plasmodium relictum]
MPYILKIYAWVYISYEKKVKITSNEFKHNQNNLLFDSSLEEGKEIKNNIIKEYNSTKKKKLKTFNFPSENIYNKKIYNLRIVDAKASYLPKKVSSVNLDSNENTNPSYFVHIKNRSPNSSKTYNTKEEKKKDKVNGITNSFIQTVNTPSIDINALNEYNTLIRTIEEKITIAKDLYVTANSYNDLIFHLSYSNKLNFVKYSSPKIADFVNCENNAINFYEKTKQDIRKRFYNLISLLGDDVKKSLYESELHSFREKVKGDLETTKKYHDRCINKDSTAFNSVNNYIKKEFCGLFGCNGVECDLYGCINTINNRYKKIIEAYLNKLKVNKKADSDFLQEIDDFLNSDNKLLRIKNGNMCEKEVKNSLKLLIEEVSDIKDVYKKNADITYDYLDKLKVCNSHALKKSFPSSSIAKELDYVSILGNGIHHYKIWNDRLRRNFNEYKGEVNNLFKKELEELGEKIKSLVYPESVKLESEKIVSDSRELFSNIKSIIDGDIGNLEYLSHGYSSSEISSIQSELNALYAEVSMHNTSIEEKMNLSNTKHSSIMSRSSDIESMKRELPLDKENNLIDITEEVLSIKKNIENIIESSSDELDILRENYNQLQKLENTISGLNEQINKKKSDLQKLKKQEDENKKNSIEEIKQYLEQMNNKNNDLQSIIHLKKNENEDLKIIETLINETSFNDEECIREKQEINERINSALRSLFDDGKLEKLFEEISQFIDEKKSLNYEDYSLNRINELLDEATEKCTKIIKSVDSASLTVENDVKPTNNKITELKNRILTRLIEDLHKKIEISSNNFNRIWNLASTNIYNYEKNKDIFKSYEDNIMTRKDEFLKNFFDKDNDVQQGTNTFQKTLDLEKTICGNKKEIKKQISDEENAVSAIREQLEQYNKIKLYFTMYPDTSIVNNIEALKERIDQENMHSKLREHQTRFDDATSSIDSSINLINFSNTVIESSKILNNIINESNKNNLLVDDLKRSANALRDKLSREIAIINEENLIEENIKTKFLNKLEEMKRDIEDKIYQINDFEGKSKGILQQSKTIKENVRNALTEEYIKTLTGNISSQKDHLTDITGKISVIKLEVASLNVETNNTINIQINEISNIIHNLIMKLDQQINDEIQKNLDILEKSKKNAENYNSENDIEKVMNKNNKEILKTTSQLIRNLIDIIETHKNKLISIGNESKEQVEASNYQKQNNDNLEEKKSNTKQIYEKMKNIMEKLNTAKDELKPSLTDINIKILEYKKIMIHDAIYQISDEKKKAEEEIQTISLYKKKIEQLKENTANITENELENFNYEEYVENSQDSQKKIIALEQEAIAIYEQISNIEIEDNIDNIKINIEYKLKDIKKKKSDIDHALKEIKNMEKMLMSTRFSSIMEDIKKNAQQAKAEKENTKEKFIETENINKATLSDIKKAEELRDLLINNLDEKSIDRDIEEIKIIKNRVTTNKENMNKLLTKAEEHKEASKMFHNNIRRGKNKIEYLKNHDQYEEKKITEDVIEEIDKYVNESEGCLNDAEKHLLGTSKNCELSSQYEQNMDNLLYKSLILAEKIKIEMKKNDATNIFLGMRDDYDNIQKLLEKLKKKLNILKEDVNIVEEYEVNEKSTDAYSRIQIIRTNSDNVLLDIDEIKQRTLEILNKSENEVDSISTYLEGNEYSLNNLEIEQNHLKNVSEILKKIENKKNILNNESSKLIDLETKISSMEDEMEISKKSYEEGILERIKKIADQNKEDMESLKKLINLNIDASIIFFMESPSKKNDITQIFENERIKMNTISESFDKSYKAIENFALYALESSTTYNGMKEKKEKAKIEKDKLKGQKEKMEKLVDSVNNIKKSKVLRFIFDMKEELNRVHERSEEEHSQVREYLESIKQNVKNITNLDDVTSSLNELNNAKIKDGEIKKSKIIHCSYKDKAYDIYNEINKGAKFIDINIEIEKKLENYEKISDTKQIVLKIQKNSNDIDTKAEESENIIIKANSIYEQIRLRDELKKRIKCMINKTDDYLEKIERTIEKCKKINKINIDDEHYDEILKKGEEYENLKKLSNSYLNELSKMDRELKINIIKTELDDNKNSLNNLEETIEKSKEDQSPLIILEKAKQNINTITDEINDRYNSVINVDTSLNELLELGKSYKLFLKSLLITTINAKISKEMLIIQKKKKDSTSCVEYIKNSCNFITNDIDDLNKSYNTNAISSYESINVEDAYNFSEEFKRKEKEAMESISVIQNLSLEVDDNKNINEIDELLRELKRLYKKFKEEKIYINDIYRNISNTKLKEMEKIAEKFIDIAKIHENIVESQKHKFLSNKNILKEIEDFIKKKEQEILTESKNSDFFQKTNNIYEEITYESKKISEIEHVNNNENSKMIMYAEKISYLIERTKSLLRDIDLYQNENDYDLSKEVNEKILEEINEKKRIIKKKTSESKEIFENIKNNIQINKELFHEISYSLLFIQGIIKNLNEIKINYQKKSTKKDEKNDTENHLNEIIKKESTNISINNNINRNILYDKSNQKSNEKDNKSKKNNFGSEAVKIAGGIFGGLLICSCIFIFITYNNGESEKDNEENKIFKEYENNNLHDICKADEVMEVSFFEEENF